MSEKLRQIVHIDMDAYFASVEQSSNPSLKGKPIIVTGSGRRTVVATASYEARKYGIKTGMTISEARELCPHVIRVDGNIDKYIYTTLKIRDILISFTDRVETYSIDEFFLDITGNCDFSSAEKVVRDIKYAIRKKTGLSCSCGLSFNKLLAKLGSEMNKPDGFGIITHEDLPYILATTPVEDLHGIGKKTAELLNYMGIRFAKELGEAPIELLRAHFGFWGYILKSIGRGIDNSPVRYYWEHDEPKSIGHSFTLPYDVLDPDIIRSCILMLCQKVATRLRSQNKSARTVSLTIRYDDFSTFCYRKTVGYLLNNMHDIYQVCLKILGEVEALTRPIRLLGVCVSGLVDNFGQRYLFEEMDRVERLNSAIDNINSRFGEFAIKPALLLELRNLPEQHHQSAFRQTFTTFS